MSDEKPAKKPRGRRRKKDAEPAAEEQPERDEPTPSEKSGGEDEATPEATGSEVEQAEATPETVDADAEAADAETEAAETDDAEGADAERDEAETRAEGDEAETRAEGDEAETAAEGDEAETAAAAPEGESDEVEPDGDAGAVEPGEDSDDAQSGEAEADRPKRRRRGAAETTTSSSKSKVEQARPAPRDEQGAVHVRAQAKYVRSAPRKARLVMDHIRGKRVADARAILRHTPRAAAADISKLLESAVANAENNFELDPDDLRIGRAYVDEGPTIKRYRPRALGRATPINKRTSHMTISLTEAEPAGIGAGAAKSRRRKPARSGERG